MLPRFADRYRIATARLAGWNYAAPARYFVTWCTAHRARVLGPSGGRQSRLGEVVEAEVAGLAYPGLALEAFVVMPDHVHVLVALLDGAPPLGVVVGAWKANATRTARRDGLWGPTPLWQARFWDVIVRTDAHADRVRAYIAANPARWRDERPHRNERGGRSERP